MTCAETRRLLPEPEPAFLDAVSEHLSRCLPCRVEQEALREIDRRMSQLGQHRSDLAATVLDAAASSPGEPPSPPTLSPKPPWPSGLSSADGRWD